MESRSPGRGQERREGSPAGETSGSPTTRKTPGGCRNREGWMENACEQGSAPGPGFRPVFPHDLLPCGSPALDDAISSSLGSDLQLSLMPRFPQTHIQLVRTWRLLLGSCLLRPTQSQSLLFATLDLGKRLSRKRWSLGHPLCPRSVGERTAAPSSCPRRRVARWTQPKRQRIRSSGWTWEVLQGRKAGESHETS